MNKFRFFPVLGRTEKLIRFKFSLTALTATRKNPGRFSPVTLQQNCTSVDRGRQKYACTATPKFAAERALTQAGSFKVN